MESARSYRASRTTITGFRLQQETRDTDLTGKEQNDTDKEDKVLSMSDWQNRMSVKGQGIVRNIRKQDSEEGLRQMTVRYIFELLFAARRNRYKDWNLEQQVGDFLIQSPFGESGSFSASSEEWFQEEESTSFETKGVVKTGDGREITFQVSVGMSRTFSSYFRQDIQMSARDFCDPLVLNFDTDAASLRDQSFYFDLDTDGVAEEISMLSAGSGYLALDKNEDGSIQDGSELFGTKSGDGFADLAQYDSDQNGWIDENDAIWSKLRIWCKDSTGNDVLYTLAQKGVGAICLSNVNTDFTLKDEQNRTNGAIRKTGVFLYESGGVGTIQHLDLAKKISQSV